jgi:hypothetical protein
MQFNLYVSHYSNLSGDHNPTIFRPGERTDVDRDTVYILAIAEHSEAPQVLDPNENSDLV